MDSAFHQLCPRYSGTLTPTAPMAIRLWETFTFHTDLLLCSGVAGFANDWCMSVFKNFMDLKTSNLSSFSNVPLKF